LLVQRQIRRFPAWGAVADDRRARGDQQRRGGGGEARLEHVPRQARVDGEDLGIGEGAGHGDRGEMHHGIRLRTGEQRGGRLRIRQVRLDLLRVEPGGRAVDRDDVVPALGEQPDDAAAQAPGAAGDDDAAHLRVSLTLVRPALVRPALVRPALVRPAPGALRAAAAGPRSRSVMRTEASPLRERFPARPTAMLRTPSVQSAVRPSSSRSTPTNTSRSRMASPPPWPPSATGISTSWAVSKCFWTSRRSETGRTTSSTTRSGRALGSTTVRSCSSTSTEPRSTTVSSARPLVPLTATVYPSHGECAFSEYDMVAPRV